MTEIMRGRVPRAAELSQVYVEHLGAGLVATDGVQYAAVATVGTTAVEVLNKLIDPGFDLALREIEVSLVQKFTELTGGTTTGSLLYHWDGRSEWDDPVGTYRTTSYVPLCATYGKGIASGANSEDTLEGYFPVASLPVAPMRIRLHAQALYADGFEGKVKNDSYIRLVGLVIPGA